MFITDSLENNFDVCLHSLFQITVANLGVNLKCLHSWPAKFLCSDVAIFPDLNNSLGDCLVIITNRNDNQNYKNKTHAEIKEAVVISIL